MTISTARALPDYHTHHELCKHAKGRTIDYARAARRAGTHEFAATDHCPTDVGFGKEHRMELHQFEEYKNDVETARREVPEVKILFGVEADYYHGCEKFLAPFLDAHELDLVLGSIHFRNYWSENPIKRGLSDRDDPTIIWREYYGLTGILAETGLYDVVTHMDLPKRFGNPWDEKTMREHALPALDKIAIAGMAIEINTSGLTHSINEAYPRMLMLSWAAERGIGLVFGSDAHTPERVGDGFEYALKLAKDAGFKEARRYHRRKWSSYAI